MPKKWVLRTDGLNDTKSSQGDEVGPEVGGQVVREREEKKDERTLELHTAECLI